MLRKTVIYLPVAALIVLGFYLLFTVDVYYKQNIDVQPLAELKLPSVLKTIYGMPCDEVNFLDGINYYTGGKTTDEIKDWLSLRENKISVDFFLYYTCNAALESYMLRKTYLLKIQSEVKAGEYDRYFVTYIERPRHPDSLFLPSREHISRVVFLKQNLVIEFYQCNDSRDVTDKEKAIKIVASHLDEFIKKQGIH